MCLGIIVIYNIYMRGQHYAKLGTWPAQSFGQRQSHEVAGCLRRDYLVLEPDQSFHTITPFSTAEKSRFVIAAK